LETKKQLKSIAISKGYTRKCGSNSNGRVVDVAVNPEITEFYVGYASEDYGIPIITE
jgi:hypothetical protein